MYVPSVAIVNSSSTVRQLLLRVLRKQMMLELKRILVPTDFSERAACMAKYAVALEAQSKADLAVLHVVTGHASPADVHDMLPHAWNEMRLNAAKEEIKEFMNSPLPGIRATPCIRVGDAATVIVEQAHRTKADVIVMATHGFGGFRRMLFGSTVAKVLYDASCPVFTSAHIEYQPCKDERFETVLCAVDLGPQSAAVVRWADDFVRSFGKKLVVCHVLPAIPRGQWGDCEADVTVALRRQAEEMGRVLIESTGAVAELLLESGEVVKTVSDIAKRTNASLLIIGRYHQGDLVGRLRDRAYAMICECPCPVVSV